MRIKFRKEATRAKEGKPWIETIYRVVDRPEFTVCGQGFEWATGSPLVGIDEEVEIEIKVVSHSGRKEAS